MHINKQLPFTVIVVNTIGLYQSAFIPSGTIWPEFVSPLASAAVSASSSVVVVARDDDGAGRIRRRRWRVI